MSSAKKKQQAARFHTKNNPGFFVERIKQVRRHDLRNECGNSSPVDAVFWDEYHIEADIYYNAHATAIHSVVIEIFLEVPEIGHRPEKDKDARPE